MSYSYLRGPSFRSLYFHLLAVNSLRKEGSVRKDKGNEKRIFVGGCGWRKEAKRKERKKNNGKQEKSLGGKEKKITANRGHTSKA